MASDEQKQQSRTLFIGIIIALLFATFMSTFVWYMSQTQPDVSKLAMRTAADTFSTSAVNAHWKWRAEGNPQRIILVEYNRAGKETDRRPVTMSHLGWPRVEPKEEGCEHLWTQMLGLSLELQGLRVEAQYHDGLFNSGRILDSYCRYRISTGPYFDYKIFTGSVSKSDG